MRQKKWIFVLAGAVLLAGLLACGMLHYRVTRVYVDGSTHYSAEEIEKMVMTGPLGRNSLYLSLKYRKKGISGVPFVDKMDVSIISANTIRISVYEKAIAGYIRYIGKYIYFTRDGVVVEVSEEKTEGIPEVTGLKPRHIVLNEKLPVENEQIFERILDATQLLRKYSLTADKIFFDSSENMTIFFKGVRVLLGQKDYMDEKIANLQHIIPSLEGKTGSIDMTGYTPGTTYTTFREKK